MLSVPGSCIPCLPGSVFPVVGALKAMPVGEDYKLLFCVRWGCRALRSEVEMAAVGWQPSHSALQQHPKFKPLGERNYFLSSLIPFRVKVHVLNHLKPEDVRLLFRSACHINKTGTLHLQNQHQKNPEGAAREGGTVWPSERGTSENLCFCKYRYNLQTISLELCHFRWWSWNIRSSNSWERSWRTGRRNEWGECSQK